MSLVRLVYASRPFGFDDAILNGILMQARRNNARDEVTGCLICRADVFLQWLEGPKSAVEAAFARIARDDRHVEVARLLADPAEARIFPGWAMRDDPARSWLWNQDEVAKGAIGRATRDEVVAVFERVAAES